MNGTLSLSKLCDRMKSIQSWKTIEPLEERRLFSSTGNLWISSGSITSWSSGTWTLTSGTIDLSSSQPVALTTHATLYKGMLTINGTSHDDVIGVYRTKNGTYELKVNGEIGSFEVDRVNEIRILGFRGNDAIRLQDDHGPISIPTHIYGGGGNDVIEGGATRDRIHGEDGDDSITRGGGNDILYGETGDDLILAGVGNDWVSGGDGNDVIAGERDADTLFGDAGNESITGDAGDDDLHGGANDDSLDGGEGDDDLNGDDGTNHVHGGLGNDDFSVHDLINDRGDFDNGNNGHGADDLADELVP
jgi:Ca2+-binding RTX toxin-like protein